MHASEIAASQIGTTRQARTTRLYYTIRAEHGYLAASHSCEGPPIVVLPTAEGATRFIDFITATRRAAALQQLGWRDLRVVAIEFPIKTQ